MMSWLRAFALAWFKRAKKGTGFLMSASGEIQMAAELNVPAAVEPVATTADAADVQVPGTPNNMEAITTQLAQLAATMAQMGLEAQGTCQQRRGDTRARL